MRRSTFSSALLAALALAACSTPDARAVAARSPSLAFAEPEQVGMAEAALDRIGSAMQDLVDEGRTAGIVTLVARDGAVVHWEAHGWRVLDEDPLEPNDLFRVYSMTKPVTSVAAMILVEEGSLELDWPIARLIPEFGGARVYDSGVLRPPVRAPTVRDLLRHTSGLTYGIFSDSPVDRMYREQLDALDMRSGDSLAEVAARIAELPLRFDPGTVWNYSLSVDVLGRVVEVASGMSLDEFFETRIFRPLGMRDTGFWVAERNRGRFTAVYSRAQDGLTAVDEAADGPFTRPPSWHSGGAGLVSTASDYLRFAQMLANEGALGGVRILRPETVRAMRTNQLPEGVRMGRDGFGLGFGVSLAEADEGRFWWSGIASTWFWIDPVEDLVVFAWTQYMPYGGVQIEPAVRELVYDAILESNRVAAAQGG